ncbi:hypothetical protein GCM10023405_50150 [Streptomonospora salina]
MGHSGVHGHVPGRAVELSDALLGAGGVLPLGVEDGPHPVVAIARAGDRLVDDAQGVRGLRCPHIDMNPGETHPQSLEAGHLCCALAEDENGLTFAP